MNENITTIELTLFDMQVVVVVGRGRMMAPQNVFKHCSERLSIRKLKPCDFSHKEHVK